jgi:hypothetical protein
MAWHSFLKYVSLPLGFVTSLAGILGVVRYGVVDMRLYALVSMGTTVAAEIGLIRRLWWGPCCLLAGYGITVACGFCFAVLGAAIENPYLVSQGIGQIISGALMLGLNWVYYQKRRALFSPEPVWLEAERAAAAPERTEYAGVASAPGVVQIPAAAGGYHAIYRETESAGVRAPEEARKEPEDGVALLLQLQAEEEAKRAAETLPVTPHEAPKKKSAPLWSVVALGALCLALAITAGALGWQWQKSNALLQETVAERNEKDDKISELMEKAEGSSKRYAELWQEKKKLQDRLAFWKDIAIVLEYDSNWSPLRYHTENCLRCETAVQEGRYTISSVYMRDVLGVDECIVCRFYR